MRLKLNVGGWTPEEEVSVHERDLLDYTLEKDFKGVLAQGASQPAAPQESVDEALSGTALTAATPHVRRRARVLMFISDRTVLEEGSQAHEFYCSLAKLFGELHVVVLSAQEVQKPKRRRK